MNQNELQLDTKIAIRPATQDDAGLILEMIRALADYQEQGPDVTATEELLIRDGFGPTPQFECIIAEVNGQSVGMAVFHATYSTWTGKRGLFIEDLFVDESVRSRGVGRALVREVARIAENRECHYIVLNVIHANPARNFYDHYGFVYLDDVLTYRLSDKRFHQLASSTE